MGSKTIPTGALLLVGLGATLTALALGELGLRAYAQLRGEGSPSGDIPQHVVCDCPYVYGLNPEHPEVSSQGLRDRVIPLEKPENTQRILLLGDSVLYGPLVEREQTFADILEGALGDGTRRVDVINAGVNGFTPYNLLHFYLHEGRSYQPDIVIVGFCMNDVADPLLHWNYDGRAHKIPPESIPNPAYHRDHVLPQVEQPPSSLLDRLALFRAVSAARALLPEAIRPLDEKMHTRVEGRWWPSYITGEDSISIEVLLDPESPESRWLWSMYDELAAAVERDGARMALVFFPLAYQMDPEYPFVPQTLLQRGCDERSLPCLDLLPAFRQYPPEETFLLSRSWFLDVWHFTPLGHQVVARELEDFLVERGWLDAS